MNKKLQDEMFRTIYDEGNRRGAMAANGHKPTPMIVQQHASPLDDNSPVVQSWEVSQGICGFAWVVIKPGTCAFAKWLSKNKLASKHYYGGISVWIGGYGQCYEKKVAHALAMADYFNSVGIKAHMGERLD